MSGLKELRNRIVSVKSTQKITKAMQLVAASRLRRAKEAAEQSRPYAETLRQMIAKIALRHESDQAIPLLITGHDSSSKHVLVIATSDRGLCGGFNASIVRKAKADYETLKRNNKEVRLVLIGRKAKELLPAEMRSLVIKEFDFNVKSIIEYEHAEELKNYLIEQFTNQEFHVCSFYYNKFKNAITQEPSSRQLIPISYSQLKADSKLLNSDVKYVYEPKTTALLNDLLDMNVTTQIFNMLMENLASEHGARMTAMDGATKNASKMIDELTVVLNRNRQAIITRELIEIISGAEAV